MGYYYIFIILYLYIFILFIIIFHQTVDDFIDVVLGNRKYLRCLYCYNKIDQISLEEVSNLARQDNTVVISCEQDINMTHLIDQIWHYLDLIQVYTKKRGEVS